MTDQSLSKDGLFEAGAKTEDGYDPTLSIAISLKRIADVMQGTRKDGRSMNATLSEIAQQLVMMAAKK